MKIDNTDYPLFVNQPIGEIPREKLSEIVSEFVGTAVFQMNSSIKVEQMSDILDSIVNLMRDKFKKYPLFLVSTAFDQGSLGQLGGTTSFNIRNVYIWLTATKEAADRIAIEAWSKEEDRRKKEELNSWKGKQKGASQYGTALYLKIKWLSDSMISSENWDKYPLDAIVSLLRAGEDEKTLKPSMIR